MPASRLDASEPLHSRLAALRGTAGLLAVVVLLLSLALTLVAPGFAAPGNLVSILEASAVTGILAIGAFVVLLAGGIDISFAATASVAQYVAAVAATRWGWPMPAVIIADLAVGIALGLVNAVLVVRFAIPAIIATIATMTASFSMLMYLTHGKAIYTLPDWWSDSVTFLRYETQSGDIVRIGIPVASLVLVALITWLLLAKINAGRQLAAVGGNAEAARRMGVNIPAIQGLAYGYLGLCAAIAGLIQAHRVGQVVPNAMMGQELNVIAAAVLGGASLTGGRGSVGGVLLGLLLLAVLQNGMNLLAVPPYFFQVVTGLAFLASLAVTSLSERRHGAGLL